MSLKCKQLFLLTAAALHCPHPGGGSGVGKEVELFIFCQNNNQTQGWVEIGGDQGFCGIITRGNRRHSIYRYLYWEGFQTQYYI